MKFLIDLDVSDPHVAALLRMTELVGFSYFIEFFRYRIVVAKEYWKFLVLLLFISSYFLEVAYGNILFSLLEITIT